MSKSTPAGIVPKPVRWIGASKEDLSAFPVDREAVGESPGGLRIMAKQPRIEVTPGSGNVFTDLGFSEPEEELAKAQLASLIGQVIKRRRLTQAAAASLMGVDQPKVSALLNGRIANFSSERLMRLLTALGRDIDIIVRRSSGRRLEGRIRVMEEARP
jgi:predicted XRE-type DNA-binding protein